MRQLLCQVWYTKYQFLLCGKSICPTELQSYKFLLPGLSESFYFDLYTSNDDSSFWKESSFWLKKVNSIKKLPISKVGSVYIWNFNTTDLIYTFIAEWKNALSYRKCQKLEVCRRLWGIMNETLLVQTLRTNLEQGKA